MIISVAELKTDLDRYLNLVDQEEIVITRNGKRFAMLSSSPESSSDDKVALIHSLIGTLPSTVTIEEARAERLAKYEAGL